MHVTVLLGCRIRSSLPSSQRDTHTSVRTSEHPLTCLQRPVYFLIVVHIFPQKDSSMLFFSQGKKKGKKKQCQQPSVREQPNSNKACVRDGGR
ncbi:hypothetical protein D623_10031049 [Myotis brandtii]|uniref:Uncharacterized protein n=1 Tax=Myotis brandtii TaxID=109478 RepID=S7NZ50_MYOBR|nr:hypothetical protein D623_10031049 [Myotis brandtii]